MKRKIEKVVIVGASSGIGMAVAEAYLAQGVKVGLAARRTDQFVPLKGKYPELVEYEKIDVISSDAPDILEELISRLGGIDLYFHIAGIGYDNPDLDPQRESDFIATNAAGLARMVAAAYNYYRRNRIEGGQIAAITSVAGTKGMGRMSAYSASKKCGQTYLVAMEQLARIEKVDVCFTDIRPGWITTPLLKSDKRYPLEMTLDYAVPRILRAVARKRRVAVIDWRWNIVVGLWRLLPNWLWIRMNPPISIN